jgi:hypothetical protein
MTVGTTADTHRAAERLSSRTRRTSFYFAMGLVAGALVLAGFGPGLLGDPAARRGAPTALVTWHAVVFGGWLALYLAQTLLVARGHRAVHRRLGWVGVPLAVAIVALGYATTIAQGRRGFALWWHPEIDADPLAELVHPLGDLLTFSGFVTAAVVWRKRPEIHKRLMLLATIGSMMAAPLAHLISYFPVLRPFPPAILLPLAIVYFSSAVRDRFVLGRAHPVSLWGGILLLGFAFVRGAFIGPSETWHRCAAWLIR